MAILLVRVPFQKNIGPFGPILFLTNKNSKPDFTWTTPRAGQKGSENRIWPTASCLPTPALNWKNKPSRNVLSFSGQNIFYRIDYWTRKRLTVKSLTVWRELLLYTWMQLWEIESTQFGWGFSDRDISSNGASSNKILDMSSISNSN